MKALRLRALDHARIYVGVREAPLGSNRGPLIDQWNRAAGVPVGSAWCMAFVHSMYLQVGKTLGGHALVQAFEEWARANGDLVARPFAGDLVCYDWNSDGWADHVGFVEKVLALRWSGNRFVGWVRTVEGNTSRLPAGRSDGVYRRTRWIHAAKFARIPG